MCCTTNYWQDDGGRTMAAKAAEGDFPSFCPRSFCHSPFSFRRFNTPTDRAARASYCSVSRFSAVEGIVANQAAREAGRNLECKSKRIVAGAYYHVLPGGKPEFPEENCRGERRNRIVLSSQKKVLSVSTSSESSHQGLPS